MARITIEDCLKHVPNMYELVLVATQRVRQIHKGADPLVRSKNRPIVNTLREIAAGKVRGSNKSAEEVEADELASLAN